MRFTRFLAGIAAGALLTLGTFVPAQADVTEKLNGLIAELSPSQQASLLLMLNEMKKSDGAEAAAPSPEEAIKGVLGSLKAALEAQDIDALLALFSDDFFHPQVGGKEEARFMLDMGLQSGYADGGEVSFDDVEIEKLDDGSYSVYPIDLQSFAGAVAVEVVIAEEDGQFAITTLDVDGI